MNSHVMHVSGPEEQMNRLEAMRRAREKQQAIVDAAAAVEAEKIREVG